MFLALAVQTLTSTSTADPSPEPAPSLIVEEIRPCFRGRESIGTLCRWVFDRTDNAWLARSSDWLIAKPARILVILLVALLVRRIVRRAIHRLAARAAEGSAPGLLARTRTTGNGVGGSGTLAAERRAQRAATLGSVLNSVASGAILTVACLMSLSELKVNIGPLIASAGILGIALGFGAQSLVKDLLSGIFMIIEDQYGVGDVTDLGDATGTVEAIGLRVTRLRDVEGTVWYVRNGEVLRVGNKSQGWARAVVDFDIAYGEDIPRAREIMLRAATELLAEDEHAKLVLEEPEVWGVEALSSDSVVLRLVVKVAPLQQWKVSRLVRERIKAAFDAADVEIPFPQRMVWLRTEDNTPGPDGRGTSGGAAAAATLTRPAERTGPTPPAKTAVADPVPAETSRSKLRRRR